MQRFDRITCGCYYCLSFFPPKEIADWTDCGGTAICPNCDVDSVLIFTDKHNVIDSERTLIEYHHKAFAQGNPLITATQQVPAEPYECPLITKEDIEAVHNATIISVNGKTESTDEAE